MILTLKKEVPTSIAEAIITGVERIQASFARFSRTESI